MFLTTYTYQLAQIRLYDYGLSKKGGMGLDVIQIERACGSSCTS
jgi:hypothetical protein